MMMITGSGSGRETKKVVVMTVLFLVVLVSFLISQSRRFTAGAGPQQVIDPEPPEGPGGAVMIAQTDTEEDLPDEDSQGRSSEPVTVPADEEGIPVPPETIRDRELSIEKLYLYSLLQAVHRVSEAELSSRAVSTDFNSYFEDPEQWRGKVIRIRGRIQRMVKRKGENPPQGLDAVYEAQVMDPDKLWHYVFLPQKPSYGMGDLVTFNGIFMKVHAYENRKGTVTLAPLYVAKDFEAYEPPKSNLHRNVGIIASIGVIICGAFAALLVKTQNKQSNAIAKAVEDKRLEKARRWVKSKKCAETPPPDANDEVGNETEHQG